MKHQKINVQVIACYVLAYTAISAVIIVFSGMTGFAALLALSAIAAALVDASREDV